MGQTDKIGLFNSFIQILFTMSSFNPIQMLLYMVNLQMFHNKSSIKLTKKNKQTKDACELKSEKVFNLKPL